MNFRILSLVKWCFAPSKNRETSALVVQRLASLLLRDYPLPSPFVRWMSDPFWKAHVGRFGDSSHTAHRRFFLHSLASSLGHVEGDTAEVGAFRGSSSALMCQVNQTAMHPRTHFIFDSFEGLSEPHNEDGEYWKKGDLTVVQSAMDIDPSDGEYVVLAGWVPDRFAEVSERTFSFVHIDVDLYEPTRLSLEFFGPRMARGGIILCDDYGSERCPGASLAVDRYSSANALVIVELPAGGCFLRFAEAKGEL